MDMNTENDTRLLHIAAEYPNAYRKKNTLAVHNFIKELNDVKHCVVAITRTPNPFKTSFNLDFEEAGNHDVKIISVRYWAPPFGLFSRFSLFLASKFIQKILTAIDAEFTCIHAHKLTTEGIIGYYLSSAMNIPFLVSVRGESDSKFYKYKPYIIPYLNKVLQNSDHVFYVSAWFKKIVSRHSDIQDSKQSNLPNFVKNIPELSNEKRNALVSVLDLNVYKKKGVDNLIEAFSSIHKEYPDVTLEIYGGGKEESFDSVQAIIDEYGLEDKILLMGSLENKELIKRVSTSIGLALPSFNETFGMVYVEALLSGVPILYSLETGIDGFIDSVEAKVGVNPSNTQEIAEGLKTLIDKSDEYRLWLRENRAEVQSLFDKDVYIKQYDEIIQRITT